MTLPDWTPEETQALARGDARVEIDYRPRTRGVRVVPMGKALKESIPLPGRRHIHSIKVQRAGEAPISIAEARKRGYIR